MLDELGLGTAGHVGLIDPCSIVVLRSQTPRDIIAFSISALGYTASDNALYKSGRAMRDYIYR